MRKFKFKGNGSTYGWEVKPVNGEIYPEWQMRLMYGEKRWDQLAMVVDDFLGDTNEWEEVFEEETPSASNGNDPDKVPSFTSKLHTVMFEIENMLNTKNQKYGNSALEPIRLFSSASPTEQLKVRIDDKLSRLKTSHIEEDEDVLDDLIGYLILLKMSKNG